MAKKKTTPVKAKKLNIADLKKSSGGRMAMNTKTSHDSCEGEQGVKMDKGPCTSESGS